MKFDNVAAEKRAGYLVYAFLKASMDNPLMRSLSEAFFQTLNSNQVLFMFAHMRNAEGLRSTCIIYLSFHAGGQEECRRDDKGCINPGWFCVVCSSGTTAKIDRGMP